MESRVGPLVPSYWGLEFSVDLCPSAQIRERQVGGVRDLPTELGPGQGSPQKGRKRRRVASPTRISSVERHRLITFPRPPGSPARASMSAAQYHSGPSQYGIQSSLSFIPLLPHLSFEDTVPASPWSPAHPQLSSSSGVGGSFRNLQGKKFRSPGYELGSDPRAAAGYPRKEPHGISAV